MAYHSLAFVLLSQPTWEFHKAPKMPDAIWMAIMGAVGYKTLDGSLSKWVITAICLINGAQFFLCNSFSAFDRRVMRSSSSSKPRSRSKHSCGIKQFTRNSFQR